MHGGPTVRFESVDETLACHQSNIKAIEGHFTIIVFFFLCGILHNKVWISLIFLSRTWVR